MERPANPPEVEIVDKTAVHYHDLPRSGDGGLEGNVEAICGPRNEVTFRRVRVQVSSLRDDVVLEDIEADVEAGVPGSEFQLKMVRLYVEQLRDGAEVDPIVIVDDRAGAFGVLDGRHRVAAALVAGLETLDAFEYVGELRGFQMDPG